MYVRVIVLKYSSKIDADAMTALAKYEMIHKLEGIISIEVLKISDLQSVAITKWHSKELAEKGGSVYIDKVKKRSNIKVEVYAGERDFIVEK